MSNKTKNNINKAFKILFENNSILDIKAKNLKEAEKHLSKVAPSNLEYIVLDENDIKNIYKIISPEIYEKNQEKILKAKYKHDSYPKNYSDVLYSWEDRLREKEEGELADRLIDELSVDFTNYFEFVSMIKKEEELFGTTVFLDMSIDSLKVKNNDKGRD